MTEVIEILNTWGHAAVDWAWPIFWQSSALFVVLWLVDLLLRRRVASVLRYSLSLLILVKLVLPPTLSLPTGLTYWHRLPAKPAPVVITQTVATELSAEPAPAFDEVPIPTVLAPMPPPRLHRDAWMLLIALAGSVALLGIAILRTFQVRALLQRSRRAPESLSQQLAEACERMGVCCRVELLVTPANVSPALCGIWQPTILIPENLLTSLEPAEVRTVLLHELAHLKRHDLWINLLQTLLQIAYWWHPLLWFANAHIRQLREQAVDEHVMAALEDDRETYPRALLAVARECLRRPTASLGLVGIIESRGTLKLRISRLLDENLPRRTQLGLPGALVVIATGALLLPMARGQAPSTPESPASVSALNAADGSTHSQSATTNTQAQYKADSLRLMERVQTAQLALQQLKAKLNITVEVEAALQSMEVDHLERLFADESLESYRPWIPLQRELENAKRELEALKLRAIQKQIDEQIEAGKVLPNLSKEETERQRILTHKRNLGSLNTRIEEATRRADEIRQKLGVPSDFPADLEASDLKSLAKYSPYLVAKRDTDSLLRLRELLTRKIADEQLGFALVSELKAKGTPPPDPSTDPVSSNEPKLNLPSVPPSGSTNSGSPQAAVTYTPGSPSPSRARIIRALDEIRISRVSFDATPLREVVRQLADETRTQSPPGLNFILYANPNQAGNQNTNPPITGEELKNLPITIQPPIENQSLADVLELIVSGAERPIMYSVEDYAIVITGKRPLPVALFTRSYVIDLLNLTNRVLRPAGLSGSPSPSEQGDAVRKWFTANGVNLVPPANVFLNPGKKAIWVRCSLNDLERINNLMAELLDSAATNAEPSVETQTPLTNLLAEAQSKLRSLLANSSEAHPQVQRQVRGIDSLVQKLHAQNQSGDSLTNPAPEAVYGTSAWLANFNASKRITRVYRINPSEFAEDVQRFAGLPTNSPPEAIQLAITNLLTATGFNFAQSNVAVILMAPKSNLFVRAPSADMDKVEQFLMMIGKQPVPFIRPVSAGTSNPQPAVTVTNSTAANTPTTTVPAGDPATFAMPEGTSQRIFPVNTTALTNELRKLPSQSPLGDADTTTSFMLGARLRERGFDSKTSRVFYDSIDGRVIVVATDAQQKIVERFLSEELNVSIKGAPLGLFNRVYWVELTEFTTALKQFGNLSNNPSVEELNLKVRELLMANGADLSPPANVFFNPNTGTLLFRGTRDGMQRMDKFIQRLNLPRRQVRIEARALTVPQSAHVRIWELLGATNAATGTAILTPEKAKALINQLQSTPEVGELILPVSICNSGLMSRIAVVDGITVVTGINPKALSPPGISSSDTNQTAFVTTNFWSGPILEVTPTVDVSGNALTLSVNAKLGAFQGYAKSEKTTVYVDGKAQSTVIPRPRFETVQLAYKEARLVDGQTLMLGGSANGESQNLSPKPRIARGRTPTTSGEGKDSRETRVHTVILITTRILDSQGNPVRTDAELK